MCAEGCVRIRREDGSALPTAFPAECAILFRALAPRASLAERAHRVNSSFSSGAAEEAALAAVAGPGVEHIERALSPCTLDEAEGAALRATTVYLRSYTASLYHYHTHILKGTEQYLGTVIAKHDAKDYLSPEGCFLIMNLDRRLGMTGGSSGRKASIGIEGPRSGPSCGRTLSRVMTRKVTLGFLFVFAPTRF